VGLSDAPIQPQVIALSGSPPDRRMGSLIAADVSDDWREELVVFNSQELRIYSNPDANLDIHRSSLWQQNHYQRSKMTWNYYSP
jgi:hypothetical protein